MRSSLPVLLGKDAKIERFPVRKSCSREKALCAAVQLFANTLERPKVQSIQSHKRLFEEIKNVIHQRASRKSEGIALEPSEQKPKVEMGLSRGEKIYIGTSYPME